MTNALRLSLALAAMLVASPANAATLLSVVNGTDVVLPVLPGSDGYNPTPSTAPDAVAGDTVKNTNAVGEGLLLDGPANLIFEFLGKEAGFTNIVFRGVDLFSNNAPIGETEIVNNVSPDGDGFLPFKFISGTNTVLPVDLVNGAITAPFGSIAFKVLSATNTFAVVLALLNDHYEGDADYDDMVVKITAIRVNNVGTEVPLPAGIVLLLSALLGVGFLGRARSKSA